MISFIFQINYKLGQTALKTRTGDFNAQANLGQRSPGKNEKSNVILPKRPVHVGKQSLLTSESKEVNIV